MPKTNPLFKSSRKILRNCSQCCKDSEPYFHECLTFEIPDRLNFLNITTAVENCLNESGIKEGLCLANSVHISSSVFINDDERGLHQDFKVFLEKLESKITE